MSDLCTTSPSESSAESTELHRFLSVCSLLPTALRSACVTLMRREGDDEAFHTSIPFPRSIFICSCRKHDPILSSSDPPADTPNFHAISSS